MKLRKLLEKAINEQLDLTEAPAKGNMGKEAAALDKLIQSIPSLYISENWGKLKTDERIEFENYIKGIAKGSNAIDRLASFISNVNAVVERQPTNASFSKLFSRLALLKTVNNIVDGFSASGGGFIFEALTAAIMGGTQVTEKEEGVLANADVLVDGHSYSMKLLSPDSKLKGSKEGLATGVKRYGFVTYIIMIRSAENQVTFYSGVVDKTNLFEKDAIKNGKPARTGGTKKTGFIDKGTWKEYSSGAWELDKNESSQFHLSPSKSLETYKNYFNDFRVLGTLKVGKEDVRTAVKVSLKDIQENISPIYDNLKQFTVDLHKYFAAEKTKEKQAAAANAKQSSKNLDNATQQTVK